MRVWPWDRVVILVSLVLVGGAVVCAVWAYRLPLAGRSDALVTPGFVLALVSALVSVLVFLARWRSPAPRPVDELANLLADAVEGQWLQEARERRLVTPAPIPVRWALSELAVVGPVKAAIGTSDSTPAFLPLPQQAQVTETNLQGGGGRAELYQVYAGLASGRIIVVGEPGAGKSAAAILLLLDALERRHAVSDAERARVPVPVLFTMNGWNPKICSMRDWLCDQLTATYPLFPYRGGHLEAAALIAGRDKVAVFLDGFDEMDTSLRPAALQALADAPFRVVLFARSREMVDAAANAWLAGAIAIHLQEVTATSAAEYLERARSGPPPAGWAELLSHLRNQPGGLLARALSTPLALTLLRDTYQARDNARALLGYHSIDAIEHHLLARVLPAAYIAHPGRPAPRYTEQQAQKALSFIARKMGAERNLAWWQIPQWATGSSSSRLARFVVSLLIGSVLVVMGALVAMFIGLVVGVLAGLVVGGLAFTLGLAGGLGDGLMGGLVGGFGSWFMGGIAMVGREGHAPRRIKVLNWRSATSPRRLLRKLTIGSIIGLGFWVLNRAEDWPLIALWAGLTFLVTQVLLGIFVERGANSDLPDTSLPMEPHEIWRHRRLSSLQFGLGFGAWFGLMSALTNEWPPFGPTFGLAVGIAMGFMVSILESKTWPTTVTWLYLQLCGQVPAVSLMPFLEDARKRGILRTVDATYQFRHAKLQDLLARQPATNSLVYSAGRAGAIKGSGDLGG